MFRQISKHSYIPRLVSTRWLSKQAQISPAKIDSKDGLQKQSESGKFDIDSLPKNAPDNFLIEFQKRKPTYDQLFEYTIDEKPHEKSKPVSTSFISPDFKIFLHRKYDFSYKAFKRILQRNVYKTETNQQKYLNRRHGILGPDLATSHFILNRGGKVRFKHNPDVWVLDRTTIPNVYDKNYRLLSVDASNVNLIYEGLDNFILLSQLEELNLSGNYKLDDWACDKLARLFRNSTTLTFLDLSNLPLVSNRGIEALYKLRSLQTLIIKGTKAAEYPFIELLIMMFNDVNPQCNIIYK